MLARRFAMHAAGRGMLGEGQQMFGRPFEMSPRRSVVLGLERLGRENAQSISPRNPVDGLLRNFFSGTLAGFPAPLRS